jgi:hypothetical protein
MTAPKQGDAPKPKRKRKPRPRGKANYNAPGAEYLERRAAANGWATPERDKRMIIKRLVDVVNPRTEEGKAAKLRSVIIAARTLASADLRQQALELQREISLGGVTAGTLADLVAESESLADELDRERETMDAGTGPADNPASTLPE